MQRDTSATREGVINSSTAVKKAAARRLSTVSMPVRAQNMRHLAVHAMIFLETRPFSMHVGLCLFVSKFSIENKSLTSVHQDFQQNFFELFLRIPFYFYSDFVKTGLKP